jgi:predicted DNA repair protein MutK
MASGLFALLDDVATITKLAAASIDDIGAAAGRAGVKAAGVVVDDTAVTPRYVHGFTPDRELPIIARIARGSLFNKLVILLPAAMLLTAFLPWAITPLLMIGGAYLCFEGVEKLIEAVSGHGHGKADDHVALESSELEKQMVGGAVRTDFILSAEIMAIALAEVADRPIGTQAAALAVVGLAITVAVYGVVALIVKMDDVGLHLAQRSSAAAQAVGRGLVRFMPVLMSTLSAIGIAAMIWVGGGIIVHGLEVFHLDALPHALHGIAESAAPAVPVAQGLVEWLVTAIGSGIVGLVIGGVIVALLHVLPIKKAH